ncbi:LPS-assembly protein LptD [Ampullimonas aquatilis]|uniref:LPS-assembly protein LptD n=1 Tax=Ampullimonas aquatilis TaxID=1341549 RepID=UPI003C788A28
MPLSADFLPFSTFALRPMIVALLALNGVTGLAQTGTVAEPAVTSMTPMSAPVTAEVAGSGLKMDSTLFDTPANNGAKTTYLSADKITGHVDDNAVLEGNAELRQEGTVVKGDKLIYTVVKDTVDAEGNVRILKNGNRFSGPDARLKIDANQGYLNSADYFFSANGGHGKASKIELMGDDLAKVRRSTYTTCTAGNADWYLKSDTMDLDFGRETATSHATTVYFQGVPIFYAPYMQFPLTDERRSGWLPPTLTTNSKSGIGLTVPYYVNIAPNRDLTIYPQLVTRRGLMLGAEFRYLEPSYEGKVRVDYLPNDNITGQKRYSFAAVQSTRLPYGLLGSWNINGVSDTNYAGDFSRTLTASAQKILTREGMVSYGSNYWSAFARVTKFQTLQDPAAPITPPYERLPQFNFKYLQQDQGGFDLATEADFTRFSNPLRNLVRGDRAVINPSISYPTLAPGYFLTPKLAYHATSYQLDNPAAGTPSNFQRSMPIASLDSGLIFERDSSYGGEAATQTLEPRLYYVYVPYRDQSKLPVFDSALADFNFSQIFSENQFVGQDRIADANQVTAALSTRYIDNASGIEKLRLSIAERFYFTPQRVSLNNTVNTDNKSDLLLSAAGTIAPTLIADSTVQYNNSIGRVIRSYSGVHWQPGPKQVLNFNYRYTRDSIEQVETSFQWPLSQHWYGVGRVNYSLRDTQVVESIAGLEYDGSCWVGRLVLQRYRTTTQDAVTAVFWQLELSGLSRIGSNPINVLRRQIPGYSLINEKTDTPSRFQDYE